MSSNNQWTADQIPDMTSKIVIVTGANSGIGYDTAFALTSKGATVVMACTWMPGVRSAIRIATASSEAVSVSMRKRRIRTSF